MEQVKYERASEKESLAARTDDTKQADDARIKKKRQPQRLGYRHFH